MLVIVILFLEVISIMRCIHQVFGEKNKLDIISILTFLGVITWLELINIFELNSVFTIITHGIFFIYCYKRFGMSIFETIISMELSLVIVSIVQFIGIVLCGFIPFTNLNIRDIVVNIFVLIIVFFVLPYCGLNKLQKAIIRRHWLVYIIISFIIIVIICALLTLKVQGNIKIGIFIFGIPAIIIIFALMLLWDKTRIAQRNVEQEMIVMEEMQNNYNDLLDSVRINQHGFDNHMMAIMSSHHIYKTYEQLVEAQKSYANMISSENRYNNILKIENQTLGGYLYVKLQDIEHKGVKVQYDIKTPFYKCEMPVYHLIEVLGVLLDNAVEATLDSNRDDDKYIILIIEKDELNYKFAIKNKYPRVSYTEMKKWLNKDISQKGKNHGIGLYRAKKLCDELNGNLALRNEQIEENNWIVFEVVVKEKEDA